MINIMLGVNFFKERIVMCGYVIKIWILIVMTGFFVVGCRGRTESVCQTEDNKDICFRITWTLEDLRNWENIVYYWNNEEIGRGTTGYEAVIKKMSDTERSSGLCVGIVHPVKGSRVKLDPSGPGVIDPFNTGDFMEHAKAHGIQIIRPVMCGEEHYISWTGVNPARFMFNITGKDYGYCIDDLIVGHGAQGYDLLKRILALLPDGSTLFIGSDLRKADEEERMPFSREDFKEFAKRENLNLKWEQYY